MSDSVTPPTSFEESAGPSSENASENDSPSDYVAQESFDELPLSDAIRRGIADRGYTVPTPVQARTLRPILAGKDLIVRSKTGTGKTAAFGIPMLEKIDVSQREVQALVLCPTRELALQVADELSALGKPKGVRVSAIYGGAAMGKQVDELQSGAQVVAGTPGRVYDLIRRKSLRLERARMGVLDEADEMLNQGFYEEVTRILECLPGDRQTLLFSATVPPDIERLVKRYTRDPETILLSGDVFTVEGITNILYYVEDAYPKPRNLLYLLEKEEPENAIVFCNTRDDTALVTAVLNRNGFDAELLNGDLPQKERERVMAKVKRGEVTFMVATDIAARGIDISDLSHVINYSLPEDPAVYLHRVGRTGRIGKKGTAISLVSGRELTTLTALEKKYGIAFEQRKLPSPEEAQRVWTDRHLAEIREAAQGSVYDAMVSMAQDIKAREDGDRLFAFLLKHFFTHHRMEKLQATLAAPAPTPRAAREEERERERPPRREREREERGGRRERRPRPDGKPAPERMGAPGGEQGTELWVNLGSSDGLDAEQLQTLMAGLAGVEPGAIRKVDLRATHSYLHVAPEMGEALIGATGKEREGKAIRVERPRRRR